MPWRMGAELPDAVGVAPEELAAKFNRKTQVGCAQVGGSCSRRYNLVVFLDCSYVVP